MKKDRNCIGSQYPMYPTYPMPNMNPGMMPIQGIGYPNMITPYMNNTNNNIDQSNNFEQQLSMLDRRITRLEATLNELKNSQYQNNNYSDSNYHMM